MTTRTKEDLELEAQTLAYNQIKTFYLRTGEFPETPGSNVWSERTEIKSQELNLRLPSYRYVLSQLGGLVEVTRKIMMDVVSQPRTEDEAELFANHGKGVCHIYPDDLVARVVNTIDAGGKFKPLARQLNSEGLKTMGGGLFTSKTVGNIYYRAKGQPDYTEPGRSKTPRRGAYVVTSVGSTPNSFVLTHEETPAIEPEIVLAGEMPGHLLRDDDEPYIHDPDVILHEDLEPESALETPLLPTDLISVPRGELAQLVALAEQVAVLEAANAGLRKDLDEITLQAESVSERAFKVAEEMATLKQDRYNLVKQLEQVNAQLATSEEVLKRVAEAHDALVKEHELELLKANLDVIERENKLKQYETALADMRKVFNNVPTFK